MGATNSKIEEDKALKLCHERKKFVRQALDGRCLLAACHVAYVQSLRSTGTAIKKFVEPEGPLESSLYTSTSATPEPLNLTEKSLSHFSFSPHTASHPVDATENLSPLSTPPSSSRFQVKNMWFRGFSSTKIEERPPVAVTGTLMSSNPQNTTAHATEKAETSSHEASSAPAETPPWDYFGFFPPTDHQYSFQEEKEMNQGLDTADHLRRLRKEEGIPDLEDEEDKPSYQEREESDDTEDEFDDPTTDTLVRSFENFNRVHDQATPSTSLMMPFAGKVPSESELLNGEKYNTPELSPLGTPSSAVAISVNSRKKDAKEVRNGNNTIPKDFFSSIKDIEYLFIRASDAGNEVPRMLEANKLHFRPIVMAKENGSVTFAFVKSCFSCGEDWSYVQEEPVQTAVKYLTWHRTASSRTSSSRNLGGPNVKDDTEDPIGNPFENYCMISGSHASTLDRLYAWEKKLYDEVKASQVVRSHYERKRKYLRQLESKGEREPKIDKTRATVKDLHSRIRVAIHRIESISQLIEELRDNELQPQLEELIEGLSRMWEVMFECHKLQLNIIKIIEGTGHEKISIHAESHRQITINLENELTALSLSFTKWIGAQKSYLQAINNWLFKCVLLPEKPSKKKRRQPARSLTLRESGPPMFVTCGAWLDKLDALPMKEVTYSLQDLVAEITRFLPCQEKNQVKTADLTRSKAENGSDSAVNLLSCETTENFISGFEHFRSGLEGFLGQLNNFADSSVKMYAELQKEIQDVKNIHEQLKSRSFSV
ncbi:hypothetical protein K2173_014280 [Erythroxylum novogranatense]|uniref:Uncharacterized protein n=1 Tax=Erythroxylum novogranatense TaxID=1862640 RepID=A0AAV8SEA6_9ROSI|nr:hypothetical protein K2173_014280 [Erythroxylum novogranatense]